MRNIFRFRRNGYQPEVGDIPMPPKIGSGVGWKDEELAKLSPERLSAMVRDGDISPNAARRALNLQPVNLRAPLAATDDLEFKIARLDLLRGDILVIKVQDHLSTVQVERLKMIFREVSEGHKMIVLERGMDLAVLTAAEIEKRIATPPSDE